MKHIVSNFSGLCRNNLGLVTFIGILLKGIVFFSHQRLHRLKNWTQALMHLLGFDVGTSPKWLSDSSGQSKETHFPYNRCGEGLWGWIKAKAGRQDSRVRGTKEDGVRDGGAVWHWTKRSPLKKIKNKKSEPHASVSHSAPFPPGFYRPVNSRTGKWFMCLAYFSAPGDGGRQLVEGRAQYCTFTPFSLPRSSFLIYYSAGQCFTQG